MPGNRQTARRHFGENHCMTIAAQPNLISAERVDSGLVLKFADGRCAFYSAALLYAAIKQAKILDEEKVAW